MRWLILSQSISDVGDARGVGGLAGPALGPAALVGLSAPSARGASAGFSSSLSGANGDGSVFDSTTRYTLRETERLPLPMSASSDGLNRCWP